jgi:hypothetical protein
MAVGEKAGAGIVHITDRWRVGKQAGTGVLGSPPASSPAAAHPLSLSEGEG